MNAASNEASDLAMWRDIATRLQVAVLAALPGWMERGVYGVLAQQGVAVPADLPEHLAEATERAVQFVDRDLAALFAADPDQQRGTPLGVLRDAVRFPSEVLDRAGATRTTRADMDRWSVPNDHFNLSPGNMEDLSPEAHELSIAWGAGKAHIHLQRRRES